MNGMTTRFSVGSMTRRWAASSSLCSGCIRTTWSAMSWSRKAGTCWCFPRSLKPKRCTTSSVLSGDACSSAQSATFSIRSANPKRPCDISEKRSASTTSPRNTSRTRRRLAEPSIRTAWLRYYEPGDRPERFIQTVQSWDTANKATELSDYSVCTTWGVYENRYYLLDVFRQRLNYPDLKRKLRELAWRDRPNKILIEDKASGTQLIQELKADGVHAVTAYQPPTGTDKIMRLHAQTALFENGRVLLPSRAPWLADYGTELTSFPGSRYDDQVDSTTQALDHLRL